MEIVRKLLNIPKKVVIVGGGGPKATVGGRPQDMECESGGRGGNKEEPNPLLDEIREATQQH